jgi:hypothetical protein
MEISKLTLVFPVQFLPQCMRGLCVAGAVTHDSQHPDGPDQIQSKAFGGIRQNPFLSSLGYLG